MNRGSSHSDRTSDLAIRRVDSYVLQALIGTLTSRQALVISVLTTGAETPSQLAERLGITRTRVLFIHRLAMDHLRRTMYYLGWDVDSEAFSSSTVLRDAAREFIGRSDPPLQKCGNCDGYLPDTPRTGRPRQWCSNRCRQAAYNKRRKAAAAER